MRKLNLVLRKLGIELEYELDRDVIELGSFEVLDEIFPKVRLQSKTNKIAVTIQFNIFDLAYVPN